MIDKLKKYEMDFTDAIFIEKIEEAYKKIEAKIQNRENYDVLKNSEKIKYECNIIKDFINTIFGEKASQDIFGESYSFGKHLQVMEYITENMNQSTDTLTKKTAKYNPSRIKR